MKRKFVSYFIILIFVLSLYLGETFAQDISPVFREQLISNTFSFLQDEQIANREKAIGEAMGAATKNKSREKERGREGDAKGFVMPQAHPYVTEETVYNDNLDTTRPQQSCRSVR